MPPPGRMPTRACVSANTARSEAIRKSQPSAISRPPVNTAPLIAPMIGVCIFAVASMQLCERNSSKYSLPSRCASFRSTPAQNAGSAPVSTTARTDSSASASVSAAYAALIRARLNAFRASGRLSVSTRTGPWSATRTSMSTFLTPRSTLMAESSRTFCAQMSVWAHD